MRRNQPRRRRFSDDVDSDEDETSNTRHGNLKLKCQSCKEDYTDLTSGTCRSCYEEATETKQILKLQIQDLNSKLNFLRLRSPSFYDVVLLSSDNTSPSIPAHRAVLTSRSPVFRAMLETKTEETIKISDVSYDALRAFVNYLYTAEACLDEHLARDLLILADKYRVKHLKTFCDKFLMSRLNWENSLSYYAFANQHGGKSLLDSALSLILDNMDKLCKREEYVELVEKDPRVVVGIYEAYLSRQVNIAGASSSKDRVGRSS